MGSKVPEKIINALVYITDALKMNSKQEIIEICEYIYNPEFKLVNVSRKFGFSDKIFEFKNILNVLSCYLVLKYIKDSNKDSTLDKNSIHDIFKESLHNLFDNKTGSENLNDIKGKVKNTDCSIIEIIIEK